MQDDDEGPGGTRVLHPDGPQTRAVQAAIAATQGGAFPPPQHGMHGAPPGGGVHTPLATQPTETIDASRWNLQSGENMPAANVGPSGSAGAPPPPQWAPGAGRVHLETDPGVRERGGWSPQLVTIVVIAAIAIAGGTFAIVLLLSKPSSLGASSASASEVAAAPTSAAPVAPTPTPTPTHTASAAPPPLPEADQQAKDALAKLSAGVVDCAEKKIHTLPGASPAVPDTFGWSKAGPYPATERDWVARFFDCTGFRVVGPMPFVIQWQVDKPGVQGTGIVWVDGDADGKPDRAYAFIGTMEGKDKMTVGAIESVDPSRSIAIAPKQF